ncbi:hypothetical protein B0J14DRAFT_665136 [Halenospora varia]|nr:hypothetical protein B0J14DRAFT_665136 [Halenospora varia]
MQDRQNFTRLEPSRPTLLSSLRVTDRGPLATGNQCQFSRFNDLPGEIRNQIWEAALPGTRIVDIQMRPLRTYAGSVAEPQTKLLAQAFVAPESLPPGLNERVSLWSEEVTNREQPVEDRRSQSSTTSEIEDYTQKDVMVPAYKNFIVGYHSKQSFPQTFDKVKHVAILPDAYGPRVALLLEERLAQLLVEHFRGLERLTIVVKDHRTDVSLAENRLIEPIDVQATLAAYKRFMVDNGQYYVVIPNQQSLRYLRIDEDALAEIVASQDEYFEPSGIPPKLPVIDYKMVLTKELQDELDLGR